jgi:hypothetical protein
MKTTQPIRCVRNAKNGNDRNETVTVTSLIDDDLANAPELPPKSAAADVFKRVGDDLADGPVTNTTRDAHLARCRQSFDGQLRHDTDYTMQQLWLSAHVTAGALDDAVVSALFSELQYNRSTLNTLSGWASNDSEQRCWSAAQQFYCDGLALADRLWRIAAGVDVAANSGKAPRRRNIGESAMAFTQGQALRNALDQALPGILQRPLRRDLLPLALYTLRCHILPWPHYRWNRFLQRSERALAGPAKHASQLGCDSVVVRGRDALFEKHGLFEPGSQRTRHNVIMALSHRHSTLDLALLPRALGGLETAVWTNARYYPRSAQRDENVIFVQPTGSAKASRMISRSLAIMSEAQRCLLIFADGGAPYLMYGQPMRVKRGIRTLVDAARVAGNSSRRTFIVPVTLDDTAFLVQGAEEHVTITFHDPIDIDAIGDFEPDAQHINHGDPLLNYLECLFVANSGLTRHGLTTPQVLEATRRFHEGDHASLKRHASLTELAQCR